MKYISIVVLFLLCQANAKFPGFPAFQLIPASYSKKTSCSEATNLPPVIDQDGLPICTACVAFNIFRQAKCQNENLDCKNLDKSQIPGLLGYASTLITTTDTANSIPFKLEVGGSITDPSGVIQNAYFRHGVASEACLPYDQFIAKYQGDSAKVRSLFSKYQAKYYDAAKTSTEGQICFECLQNDLKVDFGVSPDIEDVRKALKMDSFNSFIGHLAMSGPNCKKLKISPVIKTEGIPTNSEPLTYEGAMAHFENVLKKNYVAGAAVCLSKKHVSKYVDTCADAHALTIVGKCSFCNANGQCREALHLVNSWGQEWQDENNDGWVDAKNFYDYITADKRSITSIKL